MVGPSFFQGEKGGAYFQQLKPQNNKTKTKQQMIILSI